MDPLVDYEMTKRSIFNMQLMIGMASGKLKERIIPRLYYGTSLAVL